MFPISLPILVLCVFCFLPILLVLYWFLLIFSNNQLFIPLSFSIFLLSISFLVFFSFFCLLWVCFDLFFHVLSSDYWISFPLSTVLTVSHKVCYVVSSFSFSSVYFFIPFETSSLSCRLFRSLVWRDLEIFCYLPVINFWLFSLWSKNTNCMISVLLNLLKFALCPRMWLIGLSVGPAEGRNWVSDHRCSKGGCPAPTWEGWQVWGGEGSGKGTPTPTPVSHVVSPLILGPFARLAWAVAFLWPIRLSQQLRVPGGAI